MVDHFLEPYVDALGAFPINGSRAAKLRAAVAYAVRAPSSHNSQPWQFHLHADTLTLFADRDRALPVTDPDNRELIISCGAALYVLRLVLRRFGCREHVALRPNPANPDALASVTINGHHDPTDEERALFHAIPARATNRFHFTNQALTATTLRMLERAAAQEGAWLECVDGEETREAVAALIAEADRVHMANRPWRHAVALAWNAPAMDEALAIAGPVLAVVGTVGDTPRSWILAGQGLAHFLLRAQVDGIQGAFLNGPIAVPELRQRLATMLNGRIVPQLLMRLGYPAERPARAPRRPIDEVLIEG